MADDEETRQHGKPMGERLATVEARARELRYDVVSNRERIKLIEDAHAKGQVEHSEMRGEISAAAKSVQGLVDRFDELFASRWQAELRGAVIFWLVPIVGSAVLWAILKSQESGL